MFIVDIVWDINLKSKDGSAGPVQEDKIPVLGEMFAKTIQHYSNSSTKEHFKLHNIAVGKIDGWNKLIVCVINEGEISEIIVETIEKWIRCSLQSQGLSDIICFYDEER